VIGGRGKEEKGGGGEERKGGGRMRRENSHFKMS